MRSVTELEEGQHWVSLNEDEAILMDTLVRATGPESQAYWTYWVVAGERGFRFETEARDAIVKALTTLTLLGWDAKTVAKLALKVLAA